jgi:hypothetical protein
MKTKTNFAGNPLLVSLAVLFFTGCSTTSSVRPNSDKLSSYSFYSYPQLYKEAKHLKESKDFCESKNSDETSQIINVRNVFNTLNDEVIQTTFFCGNHQKIKQYNDEKEAAKQKALRDAEEKKRLDEAKKAQLAQDEKKKQQLQAEQNAKNKAQQEKNLQEYRDEVARLDKIGPAFCSQIKNVSTGVVERISSELRVDPSSVRLNRVSYLSPTQSTSEGGLAAILITPAFAGAFGASLIKATCRVTLYTSIGPVYCDVSSEHLNGATVVNYGSCKK